MVDVENQRRGNYTSALGPQQVVVGLSAFLPRDATPSCGVCVCVSVGVSVTFVHSVKTNKDIFEMFLPLGRRCVPPVTKCFFFIFFPENSLSWPMAIIICRHNKIGRGSQNLRGGRVTWHTCSFDSLSNDNSNVPTQCRCADSLQVRFD